MKSTPVEGLAYWQKLALLVLVMTGLRCLAAVSLPLLGSEAYYWLWGRYPAMGYDFHPPMVGLIEYLCSGWSDSSLLAARSGPIILGGLSTIVVYLLSKELFGEGRIAWRTAALFSLIPIFDAGCIVIEPDNSLMLFSALTWLFLWKATQRRTSITLWILTGAAAGLALLSKFHAWILIPPLFGFLFLPQKNRSLLRRAGPWLALLVALAILSPNLVWNAHHDWPNYTHAWKRSGVPTQGFRIFNIVSYFGGSALILTPLVFVGVLAAIRKGLIRYRVEREEACLLLLCAGLPLPIFLGLLTLRAPIALHWLGVAFVPLVVLMVALLERGELFGGTFRRSMWVSCIALAGALHLAPFAINALPANCRFSYSGKRVDLGDLKSYADRLKAVGEKAREVCDEMNLHAPTVIMAPDWHLAAQLSFYSERPRDCFALLVGEGAYNFKDWAAARDGLVGEDAAVVFSSSSHGRLEKPSAKRRHRDVAEVLRTVFNTVEDGPTTVCLHNHSGDTDEDACPVYFIWRCHGFKERMGGDEYRKAAKAKTRHHS